MKAARFLSRSRAQLRDIYSDIARDNAPAARAVVLRVEEIAAVLARHPGLGRVVSRRGVRRLPVVPYPYLIYYRTGRTVQILSVLHSARRQTRFHEPAVPFGG